MRAVLANVVERTNDFVATANGKQTLARNLKCKVVSHIGNFGRVASKLPRARQQALHLVPEDCRICVVARIKRMSEGRVHF